MTTVYLHIDRLVLDGWPGGARGAAALQAAVEAELSRLLSIGDPDGGFLGGAVPRANGAAVGWDADPATLGAAIGRSAYEGIGP